MKLLILFITLFSAQALAGNYFPVGKAGAKTVYNKKTKCQKVEAQKCYSLEGKNLADLIVVDVDIPDYDKAPILTVPKEEACADQAECDLKMADNDFCTPGDVKYNGDRDGNESLETWCVRSIQPTKSVKQMVEDESLKSARIAAEAAAEVEKSSKKTKGATRKAKLVTCAKTKIADFTATLRTSCIRALAREAVKDNLQSGDM